RARGIQDRPPCRRCRIAGDSEGESPMSVEALPRVTYSNVAADFTPLHDHLDVALPKFRATLGKTWPNRIGATADDDGVAFSAASPIDDRITLGTFVAATPGAVDRAVTAARAAQAGW